MTSFMTPQRAEPPRQRVLITQVDTTALTAVGSNLSNRGKVNIDISIHSGQTIVYPRENEEWLITKVNETWVLDKKSGFGNEGLLREANPGDLVTVTTGDYYLDSGSNQFVADSTFDGQLTANSDFSVWGNTDLGPLQIYGRLDLLGDLYMNGYHIHGGGGSIYTDGGNIICNQINSGNLWAAQIVGSQNCYFDKFVRIQDLQVIANTTTARQDVYGPTYTHGWDIDLQGGSVGCRNIGAWGGAGGGQVWGQQSVTSDGYVGAPNIWAGNAHMAVDGFGIGNAWMNTYGHFTPQGGVDFYGCYGSSSSFGGILTNGGGINTGWRMVDAGFGPMYAGAYWTNISEVRFKRDISRVEDSQLDAVLNAPLYHYRYNPNAIHPNTNAATERMVDPDAPAVASTGPDDLETPIADVNPEALQEAAEAWRFGPMIEDLPDQVVGDTPRGKAPDLTSLIYTAWGAIQELSAKLDKANEKIARLEGY